MGYFVSGLPETKKRGMANRSSGLPRIFPQVIRPGYCLSQYYLGPFVRTKRGIKYHFTRYFFHISTTFAYMSESARSLFEEWIKHFGLRRAVLYDRSSGYTSHVLLDSYNALVSRTSKLPLINPRPVVAWNALIKLSMPHSRTW
jgi:hypothetical protein